MGGVPYPIPAWMFEDDPRNPLDIPVPPAAPVAPDAATSPPAASLGPAAGLQVDPGWATAALMPPAPAPAPGIREVSVDRSRGESGRDWVETHAAERAPISVPRNSADLYGPGGANYTNADYEGRLQAARVLNELYPMADDVFDPQAARLEDAKVRGDIAIAETRAKDPMAFERERAAIPEAARSQAKLRAGLDFAEILKGYEAQVSKIEERRLAFRQTPQYAAASPDLRAKAERAFDDQIEEIRTTARTVQQAVGLASGATPGALYQQY